MRRQSDNGAPQWWRDQAGASRDYTAATIRGLYNDGHITLTALHKIGAVLEVEPELEAIMQSL